MFFLSENLLWNVRYRKFMAASDDSIQNILDSIDTAVSESGRKISENQNITTAVHYKN